MTHLSDTDQAPYSAPAPQTATVSDEAVQAALDKCENVDWVQGLVGTGLSGREVIESALTAALPHLALSAAPCSVEAKKLPCDVQLPGAIFKRGVSISTLITALERREHWPDEDTHLPAAPVDAAAVREECAEVVENAVLSYNLTDCLGLADWAAFEKGQESGLKFGAAAIRALSAEPARGEQWHRANSDNSVLFYTLRQDGWNKGQPSMVNDIQVNVSLNNGSKHDLNSVADTLFESLPAAPTSKGGE